MTRLADPRTCPNCRSSLDGGERCPSCRLLLVSPQAGEIWAALHTADRLLEELRLEAKQWTSQPHPPADHATQSSPPPMIPRDTLAAPVDRGGWNAGSIILALGALCLVVAASIFVAVSWGSLDLLGRTVVLLGVTSLFAVLAAWVTRRSLRGSSEALWSVTVSMFVIDYFAGRDAGLPLLASPDSSAALLVLGVALVGLGLLIARWALASTGLRLVAPQVAAVLGTYLACAGTDIPGQAAGAWDALTAVVIGLVLVALILRLGFASAAAAAAVGPVVAYVVAFALALDEIFFDASLSGVWLEGRGLAMLTLVVLTVAVGAATSRTLVTHRRRGVGARAASVAGALASWGVICLSFAPLTTVDDEVVLQIGIAALAVVPITAAIVATGAWGLGVRVAALSSALPLVAVTLVWAGLAVANVASSIEDAWTQPWDVRLRAVTGAPAPLWTATLAFAAIAAAIAVTRAWRRTDASPRGAVTRWWRACAQPTAFALAGLAVAIQLPLRSSPVQLLAGLALLAALATLVVARRLHSDAYLVVAAVAAVVASVIPLASQMGSGATWLAVAGLAAAIGLSVGTPLLRRGAVAASALWALGGTLTLLASASVTDPALQLILVVLALALVTAVQVRPEPTDLRLPSEVVGGLAVVTGLAWGASGEIVWQCLLWTVVGVGLTGIGLVVADRRVLRLLGAATLAVAYVLRLAASDVSVVEAYTVPIAALLLVLGGAAMVQRPALSSRGALSPGLVLGLVPSLPAALDDPTGLRALLLGVAGLVVLAVGVMRRWQAPFWFGAVVVTLLTLANVGPYANALPRWVIFAAVGISLSAVGFTWESRAHNAKTAVAYVRDLR